MSFIPSIRTCLDRVAALSDTPQLAAELASFDRELNAGVDADQQFTELPRAARRLRELHALVTDMAANLRNGGQERSAAAPTSRLASESVYQTPRSTPAGPRTALGEWSKPRPVTKPATDVDEDSAPRRPRNPPKGSITTAEAVRRIGVSMSKFYQLRGNSKEGVPNPLGRFDGICRYSAQAIDEYAARRRQREAQGAAS